MATVVAGGEHHRPALVSATAIADTAPVWLVNGQRVFAA
jgi:hypothetical protein